MSLWFFSSFGVVFFRKDERRDEPLSCTAFFLPDPATLEERDDVDGVVVDDVVDGVDAGKSPGMLAMLNMPLASPIEDVRLDLVLDVFFSTGGLLSTLTSSSSSLFVSVAIFLEPS